MFKFNVRDSIDNVFLRQQMFGDMMNQYGLVVDGKSLQLALAHDIATFQVIALACTAVVCCRLSPKQKAQVWNI